MKRSQPRPPKYVSSLATKGDVVMIAAAILILTSHRPEYTSGFLNAAWVTSWHVANLFWMLYLIIFVVRWIWIGREVNR